MGFHDEKFVQREISAHFQHCYLLFETMNSRAISKAINKRSNKSKFFNNLRSQCLRQTDLILDLLSPKCKYNYKGNKENLDHTKHK